MVEVRRPGDGVEEPVFGRLVVAFLDRLHLPLGAEVTAPDEGEMRRGAG